MAPTLALRFLTLVLFFFMNGHDISARDLKAELRHGNGAVLVSSDEAYLTGYRSTSGAHEANQHNYLTGYRTHAHDSNHPYETSYGKNRAHETSQSNYITGYRTHAHDSNQPYETSYGKTRAHETSRSNYITGYRTHAHDSNAHETSQSNYITGYRTHAHDSNAHETSQSNYITGYRTHAHDSNAHETSQSNYITGYRTHAHDSNQPYETSYGKNRGHETSQSNYLTGYRTHAHDSNQPPYTTSYGKTQANQHVFDANKALKESAHDTTSEPFSFWSTIKPYITQYGGISPKKDSKESTSAQDSTKKDSKELPTQDSEEPYVTQNGKHDPKVSTQGYEATYKKELENANEAKVDHTEAFKTGFFALDDLYLGNVMTLQFPVQEFSHFLPSKEADSIPFSMSQLPSVLQLFSISQDSPEAQSMRGTLDECEADTITGETKICATSLESMLEFVENIIGSDTKYNILTTSSPSSSGAPLQKYTILEVSPDINAPKWVACHPLPYPYAIHYCHFIATGSKVFKVSLVGENGDKVEALGICHLDTSDWSSDHILFKQLGFKPGEAPVCHFFPIKHLMWVPQPSKATM